MFISEIKSINHLFFISSIRKAKRNTNVQAHMKFQDKLIIRVIDKFLFSMLSNYSHLFNHYSLGKFSKIKS